MNIPQVGISQYGTSTTSTGQLGLIPQTGNPNQLSDDNFIFDYFSISPYNDFDQDTILSSHIPEHEPIPQSLQTPILHNQTPLSNHPSPDAQESPNHPSKKRKKGAEVIQDIRQQKLEAESPSPEENHLISELITSQTQIKKCTQKIIGLIFKTNFLFPDISIESLMKIYKDKKIPENIDTTDYLTPELCCAIEIVFKETLRNFIKLTATENSRARKPEIYVTYINNIFNLKQICDTPSIKTNVKRNSLNEKDKIKILTCNINKFISFGKLIFEFVVRYKKLVPSSKLPIISIPDPKIEIPNLTQKQIAQTKNLKIAGFLHDHDLLPFLLKTLLGEAAQCALRLKYKPEPASAPALAQQVLKQQLNERVPLGGGFDANISLLADRIARQEEENVKLKQEIERKNCFEKEIIDKITLLSERITRLEEENDRLRNEINTLYLQQNNSPLGLF